MSAQSSLAPTMSNDAVQQPSDSQRHSYLQRLRRLTVTFLPSIGSKKTPRPQRRHTTASRWSLPASLSSWRRPGSPRRVTVHHPLAYLQQEQEASLEQSRQRAVSDVTAIQLPTSMAVDEPAPVLGPFIDDFLTPMDAPIVSLPLEKDVEESAAPQQGHTPAEDVLEGDTPVGDVSDGDVPAGGMHAAEEERESAGDALAEDVPAGDVPAGEVPAAEEEKEPAGDVSAGEVPAAEEEKEPAGDALSEDVPAVIVPAEEEVIVARREENRWGASVPIHLIPGLDLNFQPPLTWWFMNANVQPGDNQERFFVTYIDMHREWHRLNITINYPPFVATTDTGLEAAVYKAATPEAAAWVIYTEIYDIIHDLLQYRVTGLTLETEADGGVHVHCVNDEIEADAMPRAVLFRTWQDVPRYTESELQLERHISSYRYEVSLETVHVYEQAPEAEFVESFVYGLHALHATRGCPYLPVLTGLVDGDHGYYLKGYLTEWHHPSMPLQDILKHATAQRVAIPWSTRLAWAKQLLKAVDALHTQGYVHGEITCENISLIPDSDRDVVDPVSPLPSSLKSKYRTVGLPAPATHPYYHAAGLYLAPELVDIDAQHYRMKLRPYLNAKADLYAVGVVLWKLAMYFTKSEMKRQTLSMRYADPVIGWGYRDAVYACLDEDVTKRKSASELLQMLEDDVFDFDEIPFKLPGMPRRGKKGKGKAKAVQVEETAWRPEDVEQVVSGHVDDLPLVSHHDSGFEEAEAVARVDEVAEAVADTDVGRTPTQAQA